MKIVNVKNYLTSSGIFIKIETDEGISGYGEAACFQTHESIFGMLEDMKGYLIGEDPARIEYLWQSCFRRLFMRGGPVVGAAVSGIDMALWDIKGKALNVPVYQLIGGLARDKVRLYGHVAGKTAVEISGQAKKLADNGVTAIRFRGFHDYDDQLLHDHKMAVRQQIEYMEAIRSAVGDDVDIILECHGRYDVEWSVRLAKEVEKYHPFLIEDPVRHENPEVLAEIKRYTSIPVAIGERANNKWDFRELIAKRYVNYLRPDICNCCGITEMKKIAAHAEIYYINIIPHNTQGPLGTAASLHASLAIPNIELMELPGAGKKLAADIISPWPVIKDGYAYPLEGPGLGVEFDEDAAKDRVYAPKLLPKLKALDGSVRDF